MMAGVDDTRRTTRLDLALSTAAREIFGDDHLIGLTPPPVQTAGASGWTADEGADAALMPAIGLLRRMERDWKLAHMIMEDWLWAFFRAVTCHLRIAYQYCEGEQVQYCPLTRFLDQYRDILIAWGVDHPELRRLHLEFHEMLEEVAYAVNRGEPADVIAFDHLMAVAVVLRRNLIDIGALIAYHVRIREGAIPALSGGRASLLAPSPPLA